MSYWHRCAVCNKNDLRTCLSVVAIVSTMGGPKERKQQSTQSVRICDECFDTPKAMRLIRTRLIAAKQAVVTGKPLVKEKHSSQWS